MLFKRLHVGGKTEIAQMIFRRNVDCAVEELVRLGRLERYFFEGNYYYRTTN